MRSAAGELALPPRLGVGEVVEGEDVKAADPLLGSRERGREALDQPVRVEAAGLQKAGHEVAVLAQVAERLTDPDPRRDAEELRARDDARDADENRQACPTRPDIVDPRHGDA